MNLDNTHSQINSPVTPLKQSQFPQFNQIRLTSMTVNDAIREDDNEGFTSIQQPPMRSNENEIQQPDN